ncbi:MAG: hypothetical protein IJX47_07900, partial [Clostridia bacterium]|nr:hypothetical protein [Clostridia bacterium]
IVVPVFSSCFFLPLGEALGSFSSLLCPLFPIFIAKAGSNFAFEPAPFCRDRIQLQTFSKSRNALYDE